MCKVIFRQKNVEKGLLDILRSTSKDQVAACAASIVQRECQSIGKQQTNFALNDKTYEGILEYSWDKLHQNLLISAPNTLHIVSAMVTNNIPLSVPSREFHHILFAIGIILHGRNRETTTLQYLNAMVLLHGGCTHRDMERLSKLGVCVHPSTARKKLQSWQSHLDETLLEVKKKWSQGSSQTFQLVGDNWDKNILPSYRTSQQTTQSIHVFNVIGVIDRVIVEKRADDAVKSVESMLPTDFIPSIIDINQLRDELTFLFARSVIANNDQISELLGAEYPDHLQHPYSNDAGKKTSQYSLGLFDCDEKKTTDVIKLLKKLSEDFVPQENGEIIEEVFFGGDRLTDERIQVAQQAMSNGDTGLERLEGFISKIEDFHRLMNFLEAINRVTFNTGSSRDRGTIYYYRNLLNARDVKGQVKNAYRAYKHLYYTVFDALCIVLFLKHFDLEKVDPTIPIPADFKDFTKDQKIAWMNNECNHIITDMFPDDMFEDLRNVLSDPDHEENYWVNTKVNDRFKCHLCECTYSYVASLKMHEKSKHGVEKTTKVIGNGFKSPQADELNDYLVILFRLTALHKNLDSAVDMGDGHRAVRSAKYETPIYHMTNKTKYLIGSIHLTALVSGTLPAHQTERLIANRCVNLSGGKNNNMALDEYVELLNRDTKNTTTGFQTKESIIQHSKEFPHLINVVKHMDAICNVRGRKGFHKLPSYRQDVQKVVEDLLSINGLNVSHGRKLHCKKLVQKSNNPFNGCSKGLSEMIVRHIPLLPFRRLRNKYM